MEQRVFVEDAVNRAGKLVFILPRFRFDGEGDGGFGEFDRLEVNRMGLIAERVAGSRFL